MTETSALRNPNLRRWTVALLALLLAVSAVWFTASKVVAGTAQQLAGTVESSDSRVLNFAITAPLVSVQVQPGQRVQEGQVLATVDTSVAQATLKADQAALEADKQMLTQLSTADPTAVAALRSQVDAAAQQSAGAQDQLATMDSAYAAQERTALARVKAAQAQVTLAEKLLAECEACPCHSGNSVKSGTSVDSNSSVNSGAADSSAVTADPTDPTDTPTPTAPSSTPTGSPAVELNAAAPPAATSTSTCNNQQQNLVDARSALARVEDDYQRTISADQVAEAQADSSTADSQAKLGVAQANQDAGSHGSSAADLATLQAKIDSDVAALATTAADLTSRTLTAPFDGVIGAVGGTAGEVATPEGIRSFDAQSALSDSQQGGLQILPQAASASSPQDETYRPLVVLYSPSSQVAVQVPENRLQDVKPGTTGTVTLPAITDRKLRVQVQSVDPTPIQQAGKTYYVVELTIENGQNQAGLMPGMTADAVL